MKDAADAVRRPGELPDGESRAGDGGGFPADPHPARRDRDPHPPRRRRPGHRGAEPRPDAPLAPPQPLKAAGRHITRATREGTIYQPGEALTPYEALEAITLDAARVLGLSDQIGSLEVGKAADFTILGQDPLTVDGNVWADIPIIASMVDGIEQFKSSSN